MNGQEWVHKNSLLTEDLMVIFGRQLFVVHGAHCTGCFIFITDQFNKPFVSLIHLGLPKTMFVKLAIAQRTLNK